MKRQSSGEQSGSFLDSKRRRNEDDDAPDIDLDEDVDWGADDDADMYMDAMGEEGDVKLSIPERSKKQWCRKPVENLDTKTTAISFQQMDTDYYVAVPRADMQGFAQQQGLSYKTYGGAVPVMRLYGVTQDGHSVIAHIHGYDPYFYVQAPAGMVPSQCEEFADALNKRMAERVDGSKKTTDGQYVRYVEMTHKQSIWNYRPETHVPFLKIATVWPQHVTTARGILESGIQLPGFGNRNFTTYESNIAFVMRYMVDAGLVGACWVTMPANSYLLRPAGPSSHVQLEADVMW
mmetsp:Transcript_66272/g.177460  ORF Transcript_66272/g.177460 Transcript_66272/m.177460 type:complete len:291 (-) Transcript_66272:641-1513(-)